MLREREQKVRDGDIKERSQVEKISRQSISWINWLVNWSNRFIWLVKLVKPVYLVR